MLDDAEAICSDTTLNVLPGLLSLVDKNLLIRVESSSSGPWFRLLETVRAYALERLRAHVEYDIVAHRHAEYTLALAEQADGAMDGSEQAAWMDRLEAVHDNLRAGLRWFVDSDTNTMDSDSRPRFSRSGGREATSPKAATG